MAGESVPSGSGADVEILVRLAAVEVENAALRQRVADARFVDAVRAAFSVSAITGYIGSPLDYSGLIALIVQAAKRVLDGRAASLLLLERVIGVLDVVDKRSGAASTIPRSRSSSSSVD